MARVSKEWKAEGDGKVRQAPPFSIELKTEENLVGLTIQASSPDTINAWINMLRTALLHTYHMDSAWSRIACSMWDVATVIAKIVHF